MPVKQQTSFSRVLALGFAALFIVMMALVAVLILNFPQTYLDAELQFRSGVFESGWYYADGSAVRFDPIQHALVLHADEPSVRLYKTVDMPLEQGDTISFYTNAEAIRFSLDGEQLSTYLRSDRKYPIAGMKYRARCQTPVCEPGRQLELEVECSNSDATLLCYPYCGQTSELMLYLYSCAEFPIVLVVFLIYTGVICLFFFFEAMTRKQLAMPYLYIVIIALFSVTYLITNCSIAPLMIHRTAFRYFLSALSFFLLPVPYLMFLVSLPSLKARPLAVLAVADLVLCVVALLLHAFSVSTLHALAPVFLVFAAVCYFTAFIRLLKSFREHVQFTIGTGVLAAYTVISLVLVVFFDLQDLSVLIGSAMLLFFVCLLWRTVAVTRENSRQAQTAAQLLAEKKFAESKALVSQINSHFFYNTMNTIRALIRLDPDSAYRITGSFCKFLRYRAQAVGLSTQLTPFAEELRATVQLAEICKARHPDRFVFVQQIETTDFLIPVLSVEPFVENAIQHGIFEGEGVGSVTLRVARVAGGYRVEVEDDGCGFDPIILETTESLGIRNVLERLQQYDGCRAEINSAPGEGTRVTLFYPEDISPHEAEGQIASF